MHKLLLLIPILAVLAIPAKLEAKDRYGKYQHWNNGRYWNGYSYNHWRGNTGWVRHRPGIDRNRDGVVTRREWRGNPRSFRRLDRNRDGVLSRADQRYRVVPQYRRWRY